MAGIALGCLVLGAAAGTEGTRFVERWRAQPVMLLQVTPVDRLEANSLAAVKGSVTEIFGNKFIVDDGGGRALVDLGPRGEDLSSVRKNETVTVQGRFDRGILHAQVVVHADGRTEAFQPPPRPEPPGPRDHFAGPPPPPPAPSAGSINTPPPPTGEVVPSSPSPAPDPLREPPPPGLDAPPPPPPAQ